MKAIVRSGYGGPEDLRIEDVEWPSPAADEVLVLVRASSMNMADVDYVRGRPWIARVGTGLREPKARIPGIDLAGEVVAHGATAQRFAEGTASSPICSRLAPGRGPSTWRFRSLR